VYGASRAGYRRYSRYVAIGDSQTEGLWDGDDVAGLVGFADRFAAMVDALHPGLRYANLAIRGKLVADVLHEQVPQALAMQPDLVTVCVGMNDVIRPGRKFGQALVDLDSIYNALADSGATVVTATFPNVAELVPLGRIVSPRVARMNRLIRAAAARHGFALVDLYAAACMRDAENWTIDRFHASSRGHLLFAAAVAESINLPGSNHDWAESTSVPVRLSVRSRAYEQLRWTQDLFMPWFWRRLRGYSSAHGRFPKRPQLELLDTHGEHAANDVPARMQRRSGIL